MTGEAKLRGVRVASGTQEACANCRYALMPDRTAPTVTCRRYPPIPTIVGMANTVGGPRPVVEALWSTPRAELWCGEYKPKGHSLPDTIDWATLGETEGSA